LDGNGHLPLISVLFIAPQLKLSDTYLEDKRNLDTCRIKVKKRSLGKYSRGKKWRWISLKENRELQVSSKHSNPERRIFRVCHRLTDEGSGNISGKFWSK
jgi:hypothetical protein